MLLHGDSTHFEYGTPKQFVNVMSCFIKTFYVLHAKKLSEFITIKSCQILPSVEDSFFSSDIRCPNSDMF